MKYLLLGIIFLLNGCSHFRVNAVMCDQIMHDPAVTNMPEQCRDYHEEAAKNASLPKEKGECISCEKPGDLEFKPY